MVRKGRLRIAHDWVNTSLAIIALAVAIVGVVPGWSEQWREPSVAWGLFCGPADPFCTIYVGIRNRDLRPLEDVAVRLESYCGVPLPIGDNEIKVEPPARTEVEATAEKAYVETQAVLGRGDSMDVRFLVPRSEFFLKHIGDERTFEKCFDLWVSSNAGYGELVIIHVDKPWVEFYLPGILAVATPTPTVSEPPLPLP